MKISTTLKSYLKGSARLFDFSGNLDKKLLKKYVTTKNSSVLSNDWKTVGNDIMGSIREYRQTYGRQIKKR